MIRFKLVPRNPYTLTALILSDFCWINQTENIFLPIFFAFFALSWIYHVKLLSSSKFIVYLYISKRLRENDQIFSKLIKYYMSQDPAAAS